MTGGASNNSNIGLNQLPQLGHGLTTLAVLGKGAFGWVVKAKDEESGRLYAVKLIEVLSPDLERMLQPQLQRSEVANAKADVPLLERELRNQLSVKHEHVVPLRNVFFTERYMALLMPFYSGGTLYEYVVNHSRETHGGLPESLARWCFQQAVLAIDYCHCRGVALRDIKLENMLLRAPAPLMTGRPLVSICDFGLSKSTHYDSAPTSIVGTPSFLAPEVLLGKEYDAKKADVWSLGMVLLAMLLGRLPPWSPQGTGNQEVWRANQQLGTLTQVVVNEWLAQQGEQLPNGARQLLQQMLSVDPALRPMMQGIMQDPWWNLGLPPGAADLRADPALEEVPPDFPAELNLIKWLSEAFPVPTDLKFVPSEAAATGQQRFQEALQAAASAGKLLLLSVHSPGRLSSHRLNWETLHNDEVVDLIQDLCVFWQVEANSEDAMVAMNAVGLPVPAPAPAPTTGSQQEQTHPQPMLALIIPGPPPQLHASRQGFTASYDVIEMLDPCLI